jgi:hypothetical protein
MLKQSQKCKKIDELSKVKRFMTSDNLKNAIAP